MLASTSGGASKKVILLCGKPSSAVSDVPMECKPNARNVPVTSLCAILLCRACIGGLLTRVLRIEILLKCITSLVFMGPNWRICTAKRKPAITAAYCDRKHLWNDILLHKRVGKALNSVTINDLSKQIFMLFNIHDYNKTFEIMA